MRQLLVVRHGKATESHPEGDRFRPLSAAGRERIRLLLPQVAAKGFVADLALSSPYLRARETADLFAGVLPAAAKAETLALTPEAHPSDPLEELRGWAARGVKSAVLYSHNPLVTELTCWLLTDDWGDRVEFHTPSLWALEFPDGLAPHQGRPLWVLHP